MTAPSNGNADRLHGKYQDVATFTCGPCHGLGADGFGPHNISLMCNSSGLWTDTEPTCQSITACLIFYHKKNYHYVLTVTDEYIDCNLHKITIFHVLKKNTQL